MNSNMGYKLVRELKDKGYPQDMKGGDFIDGEECDVCGNHVYYSPTLSELIEACGDENGTGFHSLKQEMDFARRVDNEKPPSDWIAEDWKKHVFIGDTPEEAVARLWLALNKKQ